MASTSRSPYMTRSAKRLKQTTLWDLVKDYTFPVNGAYFDLSSGKRFFINSPDRKENILSIALMLEARQVLMSDDYLSALKFITHAICKAEITTDALPGTLAYRAGILTQILCWRDALKDIDRALSLNIHETDMRAFLLNRRPAAVNFVNTQPIVFRNVPPLPESERNELFPCSSNRIKVVEYEKRRPGQPFGRRVVAVAEIPIGVVIAIEKPLVVAPIQNTPLFCHECMLFSLNTVPCLQCPSVVFCTEACRELAWRRYHKYECKIQSIIEKMNPHRLAIRIALSFHDYIDPREDMLCCPEEYKDLLNREIVLGEYEDELKKAYAFFAAQIFYAVKEHTDFFNDIKTDRKYNIFKGLIIKLIYLVQEYSRESSRSYRYAFNDVIRKVNVNWTGIYQFLNNCRTACAPNVSVFFHETTMEMRTLRKIEPGEEIFMFESACHYSDTPKDFRQRIFREKYAYTCHCEACENNWPLTTEHAVKYHPQLKDYLAELYMEVRKAAFDPIKLRDIHSEVRRILGKPVERPSVEWLIWQHILLKLHEYMTTSCDLMSDFLQRRPSRRYNI